MIDLSLSFFHFVETSKKAGVDDRLVFSPTGIQLKPCQNWYSLDSLLNSDEIKQENAKAWQVFRRTILDTYGETRVQRICKKYNLDLDRNEQEGKPLQRKHIEMICIGAEQVFVADIKSQTHLKAKWLPPEEIAEIMMRLNPFPYTCEEEFSADRLDGGPTESCALVSHDPYLMDKEKVILLRDLSKLSPRPFLERLTKTLANRELEKGMVLRVPGLHGREDFYKVYQKIAGEGLVAYALKPLSSYSHLKPMLIFRPTQASIVGEDAPQSWLNDLEAQIGRLGYEATKTQFDSLMTDSSFCRPDQKIEVAGYSLGGTHAQLFVADHWKQVSKASFFNDPSVDSQTAEEFAAKVNAAPEKGETQLSLEIYRTKGDVAHYVGEKHIGWGITHPEVDVDVIELDSVEEKFLSRLTLHAVRFFDQPRHEFVAARYGNEEINRHLDNAERGPEVAYWENLRRWGGCFLAPLVRMLYKITRFTHQHWGISPFRYTEERKPALLQFKA
jgi:hypothetical protein